MDASNTTSEEYEKYDLAGGNLNAFDNRRERRVRTYSASEASLAWGGDPERPRPASEASLNANAGAGRRVPPRDD